MQIQLDQVTVWLPGGKSVSGSNLTGAVTATQMPGEHVHTQWRLAVLVPLTEAEYRALVPKGTEHL